MEFSHNLSGIAAPLVRKFQVGETMATAGVPVVIAGTGDYGLKLATTVAAVNCLGITQDTATAVTAQQSDSSDTARTVSVICNPDAIFRAKLSGGATENTALTEGTVDTASTTGLLIQTNVDYSSPSFDEGSAICSEGANMGLVRVITSLSGTDLVPSVAFPYDIAVGDKFIALPWKFSGGQRATAMQRPPTALAKQYVELTTLLNQVNASVTIDTNNVNFVPTLLVIPADENDIPTKLAIEMVVYDHLYAAGPQ